MKFNNSAVFRISLIMFSLIASPVRSACFDVIVNVSSTKADGRDWDSSFGNIAPDIQITIDGRTFPKCQDSYQCMLYDISPSKRVVEVEVWDLDAASHDLIGRGHCALGQGACPLGQATLIAAPCQ